MLAALATEKVQSCHSPVLETTLALRLVLSTCIPLKAPESPLSISVVRALTTAPPTEVPL